MIVVGKTIGIHVGLQIGIGGSETPTGGIGVMVIGSTFIVG